MKAVEQPKYYWTYIMNDEMDDMEGETQEDAQQAADDEWCDRCESDSCAGETEIELIRFYYDDEGEKKIVKRIDSGVEYARGKSDYDEHGTLWMER